MLEPRGAIVAVYRAIVAGLSLSLNRGLGEYAGVNNSQVLSAVTGL